MVTLSPLEMFQGSLTLIAVLISFILGLIIILKYFKFKRIQLLLVGVTWILLMSVYWPDAITFILILTTGNPLNKYVYFFLANAFIAPVHITWVTVITDLIWKKNKKIIRLLFAIEAIIFEVIFLSVFFIDPDQIGTQIAVFVVQWALFVDIYLIFSIVMFLGTGLLFARESLKAQNAELQLKAKFLILAFVTFTIGAVLDVAFESDEITIFLARLLVIIAAFAFYIGFTLPKFIKELFVK